MEGLYVYPEEFVKSLLPSLSYLKRCNIVLLDTKSSFWKTCWSLLYVIPFYILYYISLSMYILKLFTEGLDPFEKADMIPMWFVSTQELLKFILIMRNRKEVGTLIEHLGSMWRATNLTEEQLKKKSSALKHLNIGQKILSRSATVVSWQYLLLPLAETIIRIFFLGQEAELALPLSCVYPFEVDSWPTYLVVYAFQFYNVSHAVNMYLGTNLQLVTLSTCLSIQFTLLQDDLINIKPRNNNRKGRFDHDDEIIEYTEWSGCSIEEFIQRQQYVIMLTDQLNAVFNKIVFINLLFSTLIICFFAVAAKASTGTAYMLNNYATIIIVMWTVFVMCYCSELLNACSTGIGHSAAKSLWYKGDLQYQTTICFIIMRSQKPCSLRALNYSSMSMKTFNKVLKTTYSYFSLASQMYDLSSTD